MTKSAIPTASRYLQFCEQHLPDMLAMLQCLVERESPSENKDAVDRLGEVLAQEFASDYRSNREAMRSGVGAGACPGTAGIPQDRPQRRGGLQGSRAWAGFARRGRF